MKLRTTLILLSALTLACAATAYAQGKTDNGAALIIAVEKGDAAEVERLLENGANINAQRYGGTPLMTASENGHLAIVKLLLAKGADVHAKTYSATALMRAS